MVNHRAAEPNRAWWHTVRTRLRPPPTTPVPAPHPPGIELVDAQTRITHQVSSEQLLAGRAHGKYGAQCGAQLLVASLTDPGRGRCQPCQEQITLPAPSGQPVQSRRGAAR